MWLTFKHGEYVMAYVDEAMRWSLLRAGIDGVSKD